MTLKYKTNKKSYLYKKLFSIHMPWVNFFPLWKKTLSWNLARIPTKLVSPQGSKLSTPTSFNLPTSAAKLKTFKSQSKNFVLHDCKTFFPFPHTWYEATKSIHVFNVETLSTIYFYNDLRLWSNENYIFCL